MENHPIALDGKSIHCNFSRIFQCLGLLHCVFIGSVIYSIKKMLLLLVRAPSYQMSRDQTQ